MRFRLMWVLILAVSYWSCKDKEDATVPSLENQSSTASDSALLTPALDSSLYQWEGDYVVIKWEDLLDVSFQRVPHALLDSADIPQFNSKVQALNGKSVIVEGFYIPVEETGDDKIVILSAFPYVQCFFCGQAGVESIIDVLITTKLPKIKTDTKVRFKGKFKTNATDFDYLIYVLENAEYLPAKG